MTAVLLTCIMKEFYMFELKQVNVILLPVCSEHSKFLLSVSPPPPCV